MQDDPKPNLDPEKLIEDLTAAILAERKARGIAPDTQCSLDLRYDNGYIGGLLSDDDISDKLMMATECPLIIKNYMKPIGDDFSGSEVLYRHYRDSFDTSTKAKVVRFANVAVAFLLTPIDGRGAMLNPGKTQKANDLDISQILYAGEIKLLKLGNALIKHDYFYIPVITFVDYESTAEHQFSTLEYEVSKNEIAADGYASKVPAGKTLWQAIKEDLAKDFGYKTDDWQDNWFAIDSIKSHDATPNKKGQLMDRVLVKVYVAKQFDTAHLKPAGMHCHWGELSQTE